MNNEDTPIQQLSEIFLKIKDYLLTKEEMEQYADAFKKKIRLLLKEHYDEMIPYKSYSGVLSFSTTYGPYIGNQFALYIGWNKRKDNNILQIDELFHQLNLTLSKY